MSESEPEEEDETALGDFFFAANAAALFAKSFLFLFSSSLLAPLPGATAPTTAATTPATRSKGALAHRASVAAAFQSSEPDLKEPSAIAAAAASSTEAVGSSDSEVEAAT